MENSERYDDMAIHTVEVSLKENGKFEVLEAKESKICSLIKYDFWRDS